MKKTAIGLICKKTICTYSTRFCTFFCRSETSGNFLVPRYMEEMLYVYLFNVFFVFHVAHFQLWWKQAFLIFSPSQQNFMLFLLALALSLVELRWPVALLSVFLLLSLSLYSKFVGMTINPSLTLQTTHRNIFLFPFSSF